MFCLLVCLSVRLHICLPVVGPIFGTPRPIFIKFLPRDAMHARYMLWLSGSVSVSQVGVLLKRLNTGSHKQNRTIAQGLWLSGAKDLCEIPPGAPNGRGRLKSASFDK